MNNSIKIFEEMGYKIEKGKYYLTDAKQVMEHEEACAMI